MLYIILNTTNSSSLFAHFPLSWGALIGIACVVGIFIVIKAPWCSQKSIDRIIESIDDDDEENQFKPGDYMDSYGNPIGEATRVFRSARNKDLTIRIINTVSHKFEDKDKNIFVSSLPHHFTEEEKRLLLLAVPKLTDVDFSKSHDLVLTKSSAVNFFELRDDILRFLFIHLDEVYYWMVETQSISIGKDVNQPDCICIYLRSETKKHLWLREQLLKINGILDVSAFNLNDNFNFFIERSDGGDFKELLPKIKAVISDYFKAGVNFSGEE